MKELLKYILEEAKMGNDKIKISLRDELILNLGMNLEVLVLELSRGTMESNKNGKSIKVPLAKMVVVGNGTIMIFLRNELLCELRQVAYVEENIANEI